MNAAEFRLIREHLGLTAEWLAVFFGVNARSVKRWESAATPVPPSIAEQVRGLEAFTRACVAAMVRPNVRVTLPAALPARLLTARSDEGMLAVDLAPNGYGLPPAWHRAATARAREELIRRGREVVVAYIEDEAE